MEQLLHMASKSNHMSSCPLNLACNKAYKNKLIMDKLGSFSNWFSF